MKDEGKKPDAPEIIERDTISHPAPSSPGIHPSSFILHPSHSPGRPTMACVDLSRLEKNYRALRTYLPSVTKILGIVKADGYGHGSVPVARCLERLGIDALGVGIVSEGLELRAAGIRCPILVLDSFWPGEEALLLQHDLTPTIYRMDSLRALSEAAGHQSTRAPYHIKIDTGMGRLGVDDAAIVDFVREAHTLPHVAWTGFFSHLSSSDEVDSAFTCGQIERFRAAIARLEGAGFAVPMKHLANSAGLLRYPEAWFDMVRPGIALYGVAPGAPSAGLDIAPILSLKTQIMFLKRVPAHTPISYNRRFVTRRESLIGVIPIGYADGVSRRLSNTGYAIVRDHRAPIVGAVTMDMTLLDVTDVPDVRLHDEVILIGQSAHHSITAETLAQQIQTIPYEVFCSLSKRVTRCYFD